MFIVFKDGFLLRVLHHDEIYSTTEIGFNQLAVAVCLD